MLDEIPSSVLDLWMAYFSVEPFGEIRADMRAALDMCLFANANRGKNRRPYHPRDFMLKTNRPSAKRKARRMSGEEMLAQVEQINQALGGRDVRRADGDS